MQLNHSKERTPRFIDKALKRFSDSATPLTVHFCLYQEQMASVYGAKVTAKRHVPSPDQPALLPLDEERPPPCANDLTQAWCSGYSRERNGKQPHKNVVARVGRVAKNIAKDCTTLDEWRQAWQASLAAGRRGLWDITICLIDETPRSLYSTRQGPGAILREVQADRQSLAERQAALGQ